MNEQSPFLPSIESYAQQKPRFILNDLAASTGIALADIETGIAAMMNRYECRLQVTEKGEIIYDFGNLQRRGEKTLQEKLHELKENLWIIFKYIFRIWIAVTLVAYFAFFFVILLGIIIAQIALLFSSDSDSDSDFGIGDLIGGLFRAFIEIFYWNTVLSTPHTVVDSQGYPYKEYQSRPSKRKRKTEDKKTFINSVYDYVFGVPRYKEPELAYQQEIAAFLQKNKGYITPTELKALNGLPEDQADKLFSDVLIRFEGKPEVSEEGVLYGDFTKFATKTQANQNSIVYFWDEYEPEHKLTGNNTARNVGISFLNGFNLFFGLLGVSGFYNEIFAMPDATWLTVMLGYVPVSFSAIFYGVPLVRAFGLNKKRKQRHQNNLRKRVMQAIFVNQCQDMTAKQLLEEVNSQAQTEKLSLQNVEEIMSKLILDVRGEVKISEQTGEIVYDFQNMRTDLEVAQKLRNESRQSFDAGDIVFDTQAD